MDFDFQWLLLGLPIAFALGWVASRIDLRQVRRESRDSPRAYFKGLNLLLNEQQDKAIDAFVEAVQHDPDTTDLHFALGNLFRRRGEFERSVRVHQHLLARADLKSADRERAQLALAQDFMKAGLFDRAEAAWRALEGTSFDAEARQALLSLAERSRDWARAVEIAHGLRDRTSEQDGDASAATRLAHYECERAIEADAQGKPDEAEAALARAREASPQAARPLLLAGQRHAAAGRHAEAMAAWDVLREQGSGAFLLVAEAYAESALQSGRAAAARDTLTQLQALSPALELVLALDKLDGPGPDAEAQRAKRIAVHLSRSPTLLGAARLLADPVPAWGEQGVDALRRTVGRAAQPLNRYRCAACGFEAQHYFWQCPGCLNWDSYPTQRIDAL